jgi:hypothetical protein
VRLQHAGSSVSNYIIHKRYAPLCQNVHLPA